MRFSPPRPLSALSSSPAAVLRALGLTALLVAAAPSASLAQTLSCSSDGQQPPTVLLERFISADCAVCWSRADTPRPPRAGLALDWIVPGTQGDDAPLSIAATREALYRLQALQRPAPATDESWVTQAAPPGRLRLRVAQGPALGGYIGASIELRPASGIKRPFTTWLALVETIPAGVEGSPVERNLVRNLFQPRWGEAGASDRPQRQRYIESRPMNIPEGADPARLRVVGWVEDANGQIRVMAQSRCKPGG